MRALLLLALGTTLGCSGGAASPASTVESPASDNASDNASDDEVAAPVTGALCGTRGAAACGAGTFCDFAAGSNCGADDRGGHCAVIPDVCTREYMPVCGCDGQTHPTACTAHSHGVAVAHDGPC
jgi:hypothetical protein